MAISATPSGTNLDRCAAILLAVGYALVIGVSNAGEFRGGIGGDGLERRRVTVHSHASEASVRRSGLFKRDLAQNLHDPIGRVAVR
jgi:hypothetical protein